MLAPPQAKPCLGSLGGHEVHKTVKFEPPRTPRTQRSEAAFIKGAISRNRTELPGRPAISSWRSWRLGGSIRMGLSSPLSFTRRYEIARYHYEMPYPNESVVSTQGAPMAFPTSRTGLSLMAGSQGQGGYIQQIDRVRKGVIGHFAVFLLSCGTDLLIERFSRSK